MLLPTLRHTIYDSIYVPVASVGFSLSRVCVFMTLCMWQWPLWDSALVLVVCVCVCTAVQ